MRTVTRWAITVAGVCLALSTVATATALGGGAVWHFDGYHEPGDVVVSGTAVSWSHNTDLGTPDDGPYLVYMTPVAAESESWPEIPEEGLLVGVVEVHLGPYTNASGESRGPHRAVARFEIPDIPSGSYQIMHCNDPCQSTLGDVVGGRDLRVIEGPNGRPADEIAAEVRERIPTVPLVVDETTATSPSDNGSAEAELFAEVQRSTTQGAIGFDTLWLGIVGVVSSLLVGWMFRSEVVWNRAPTIDRRLRNETRSRDVLTDE